MKKSVHVIPKTEVAEYRHLRKVQYLKDNVLTSIITPPPPPKKKKKKKKKQKQNQNKTKQTNTKYLRLSVLTIHMWVWERSSKCAYNNEDTFAN